MSENKEKLKRLRRIQKIVPAPVFRKLHWGYCKHKNCPFRAMFPNPYNNYSKLKNEVEKEKERTVKEK